MSEIRAFLAVEIPGSERHQIMEYIEDVRAQVKTTGVRWVNESQLHITVKFLGNADESVLEKMTAELERRFSRFDPFSLKISEAGFFPSHRAPRIFYLSAEGDLKKLSGAHEIVEQVGANFRFQRERRPYVPHVTLARIKNPHAGRQIASILKKIETPAFRTFEVSSIVLMKSELLPAGARYSKLHEIHFHR